MTHASPGESAPPASSASPAGGGPSAAGRPSAAADVAIIGAGVIGTAIARELSRYQLSIVLLDAAADVGTGTTKANTAILHTGFDAVPGSLESRLLRRGSALLREYAAQAGIPVENTGALLVAWTAEQELQLPLIEEKARRNGYSRVRPVTSAGIYQREPYLGPGALAGLEIPDESIICPWTTPLAYATEAVRAGVRLMLETTVTGVRAEGGEHWLATTRGIVRARWLINAAGLGSDRVDAMLGAVRGGFTIRPRRGELIVFDKLARPLLRSIVLPVPTAQTKGVLVAPTVYGNVLLGPTAQDVDDPSDTATTAAGLAALLAAGRMIMPALLAEEITATYAGLRAATEHRDYQIRVDSGRRYACVAGIRSTGLSASLGIAEYVAGQLDAAGLPLKERGGTAAGPPGMPYIGQAGLRPYQDARRIAADPEYGRIACHCERVTRGEIRDALASAVPPADIDGLRRRTRVLNGRCQGFYCAATVSGLMAAAPGQHGPRRAAGIAAEATPAHTSPAPATPTPGSSARASVNVDVLIVGAGPAGLAAAIELRRLGVGRVLVADREQEAGGVPRHSRHTGYGLRDLRRMMTGPAYARHYADAAARAGAMIRTGTTVTALDGMDGAGDVEIAAGTGALRATLTSPAGVETVAARAVLLATGCRERPRPARLVPGDRPPGVMTTGELQQRVYLAGQRLPGRALIVGAEHVSFSAMVTLAHAGADVVALVTDQPRHQSYAAFALGASLRWRVPLWTSTAVRSIIGRPSPAANPMRVTFTGLGAYESHSHRVGDEASRSGGGGIWDSMSDPGGLAGVEVEDLRTGTVRFVPCATLVFTGDWIPDHELGRLAGVAIDHGTRGPAVDMGLQTSVSRLFAAGNLVHAAETADVAALGGRHAAGQIAAAIRTPARDRAADRSVPITVASPLAWISPNVIADTGGMPPRGRFLLRSEVFARRAQLEVRQQDRVLATARARLVPGRPVHLDAAWLAGIELAAGPVQVGLR